MRPLVAATSLALLAAVAGGAFVLERLHKPPVVVLEAFGPAEADTCAVLVHGLARTGASMTRLGERLAADGHAVVVADYPSRAFPIETLAAMTVPTALDACRARGAAAPHVVTHSLGGILLRAHLAAHPDTALGRVVMLAPPNGGSEVVDALGAVPGYRLLNGPAGLELGTGPDALPVRLGATAADVAVISGTTSINLVLSLWLPNPDDGKVSLASARLEGMCAFLAVPVSHPFVMKDDVVLDEVAGYLSNGRLVSPSAEHLPCPARDRAAGRTSPRENGGDEDRDG